MFKKHVMEIKKETLLADKRVLNGIIKIKIEYKVEDHSRVLDFAGLQSVDSIQSLFQLSGMPPKCLHCLSFGHLRKACPKAKMRCNTCHKVRHQTEACTFANRVTALDAASLVNDDDAYNDYAQEKFED